MKPWIFALALCCAVLAGQPLHATQKLISGVPNYDQDIFPIDQPYQAPNESGDCAPVACAMLHGYYDANGWPRLIPYGSNSITQNAWGIDTVVRKYKTDLNWRAGGVSGIYFQSWSWLLGLGFGGKIVAGVKSYDPNAAFTTEDDDFTNWSRMTGYLSADRPCVLAITPRGATDSYKWEGQNTPIELGGGHVVCAAGWSDVGGRWLICNMGWSYTMRGWLNYDSDDDWYISQITAGGTALPEDDDSNEDNDTFSSARAISAGTISGLKCLDTLLLSDRKQSYGDWFKVNASSGQSLTASISFTHANGDLDLALYDPNGNFVSDSTGSGNSESVNVPSTISGYYYIFVYGYQGAKNSNYSLSVNLVTTPTVATPTIAPAGGSFSSSVQVTLACATSGATIRYTTNGNDPTSSSTAYSSAFTLSSSATVKAKAFLSGYNDSAIASSSFTITATPTVATPTISPDGGNFTDSVQVTLACATSGATIRYTTNGSDPTSGSTAYTSAFTLSNSATVKARAFKSGSNDSVVASAAFTISATPTVATPTISPNGGSFTSSVQISLASATSGATIRYTTNGNDPTSASTAYTSAFTLTNTATVKAKAFKSGSNDSAIASAGFTITGATSGPSPPQLIGPGTAAPSGATSSSPVDVPYGFTVSLSFVLNYQIQITDTGSNTIVYTSPFTSFSNFGNAVIAVPYANLPTGRSYSWIARSQDSSGNPGNWSSPLYFSIPANTPAPTIGVTPTSLSFSAVAGAGGPLGQTITVSNGGGGTLNWSAAVTSGPFDVVGTTSGAGGGSFQVFVSSDAPTSGGTYSGNIRITASGATNTPKDIPVTLTVTSAATPTISVSPTSLSFAAVAGGGGPLSQTISVSNSGGGTLNWSAAVTSGPFDAVGTTSGANSGSFQVFVSSTPASAGTYTGTIRITASGASNTPQDIGVTLTVTAATSPTKVIGLAGDLAFGNVTINTMATRMLTISNTGTTALAVTGISYPPGFSGNWSSGTITAGGSQAVTVTFAPTAVQSYSGTITVSSDKTSGTNTIATSGSGLGSSSGNGGPLTNGDAHEGTIAIGGRQTWTISAATGDSIVLRVGELTDVGGFYPQLQLFDPTGTQVQSNYGNSDAAINYRATMPGIYTVVVSSATTGGAGTYRLHVAKVPGTLVVPANDEGGLLTNGGAHDGTISIGDLDAWTISATTGDSIALRIGELTDVGGFYPQLQLFDPTGAQVQSNYGNSDAAINYRATVSGTYTVIVSSASAGGMGTYRLHVVKAPGALSVPPNDEGGVLTNGGAHSGAISIGDLDAWTIAATNGDSLVFRVGELTDAGGFYPQLQLFDPTGAQVQSNYGNSDAALNYRATVTGTYTVVVSSASGGGTGTYRLHVVKAPGTFTVPTNDDGGVLTAGAHDGTITIGDLDAWTIAAGSGDSLALRVTELTDAGGFYPQLQLFDPNGAQVQSNYGTSDTSLSYRASLAGVYTLVVSSASSGGGTYRLTNSAPLITGQPQSQGIAAGSSAILTASASGGSSLTYQWQRNGSAISGAAGATFTLTNVQPANAGLYSAAVTSDGTTTSDAAIVGVTTTSKVIGTGSEVGQDIYVASNNNTFDQVLLQGTAATVTADRGQITRISYVDLTNDIVQVEFSGAGTLTLNLDSASGPAIAINYNQSSVTYMKGHASIVIVGADETTNVGVFSVGRITAVNQALFRTDVSYDGMADIAYLAIQSTNGKFGGLRTANATYYATRGFTGIYAPGVQFSGPVFVGDISAFDSATPVLMIGSSPDTRVTGGDLLQANGQAVKVSGLAQLKFTAGSTSHAAGNLPAQNNKARLEQNGVDVTSAVVVNPTP